MENAERKDFRKPDEVRQFPMGRLELISVGGAMVGRAVFEPGWRHPPRSSRSSRRRACEALHFQYHASGVLRIRNGRWHGFDCKLGDVSLLPSGHDAWVVGDEPAVVVDFQGMINSRGHGNEHA